MAARGEPLVLRLDGKDAASPGPVARMTFGLDGGTIGSSPDCAWVLNDPERSVEERHARILLANGRYFIIDTSAKGVFVGDDTRPLGPGASSVLRTGDRLRIGRCGLTVEAAPTASSGNARSRRASSAGTPGPESLLASAEPSGGQRPSPGPNGGVDGSTLSDEWEQHLASLLGPAAPAADGAVGGDATAGAPGEVPPANLDVGFPSGLAGPPPLASGLLVADPAHGPLTALLASSGASGAAPQALASSATWGSAEPPAIPTAGSSAPATDATGGRALFSRPEGATGSANGLGPTSPNSSVVALRNQDVSPWDISRPEAGPPRGLGDGVLRGLGLALPSLSEEQMGALGYDLGRALGALADLLVELSQREGVAAQRKGEESSADPFTTLPTGLLALSELMAAQRHGRSSIEGAVRASIQRLRRGLDSRSDQQRRMFQAALTKLQERHALRVALAQLDPQRFAAQYGLDKSRRRAVKARAWDLFKANYPQVVELALTCDRSPAEAAADLPADADAARTLRAFPERSA
jgi:predicted component of type VI protein secretion system